MSRRKQKWQRLMPNPPLAVPLPAFEPPPPDNALISAAKLDDHALCLAAGQVLHHIHRSEFSASSFNPGFGNGRFHPFCDADGKKVPIFYAANTEEGAYCETLLRALDSNGISPRSVPSKRFSGFSYAQLQNREPLNLAHLCGNQLIKLGLTRAVLLEPGPAHYPATSAWAKAIHQHYPSLHGIAWLSRQHDASTCYMLFGDRVAEADLQLIAQQDLNSPQGRQMADALGQRLNIVITR